MISIKKLIQALSPRLPLFGALLIIQSVQMLITFCSFYHVGIGLIMGTIAWAYLLAIPQKCFKPGFWSGIYAGIVLTISSVLGLIQFYCELLIKDEVNQFHLMLIANTNINESFEFLSTFTDSIFILIAAGIAVLAVLAYWLMKRVKSMTFKNIVTVVSICSLFATTFFGIWDDCGIGRAVDAVISILKTKSYDLNESQPQYEVCGTSRLHPNIILIIGESFDKYHSSLYGYDKDTNPLLSDRMSDSTMVLFQHVESPAPITPLSIRVMLSLADRYDDELWFENPVLPTALAKCGYRTMWLSNQSGVFMFDSCVNAFAQQCDSVDFVSSRYEIEGIYDDVLLNPFKDYISGIMDTGHNFCVVHLMGSHFSYDLRYPSNYEIFTASDYADRPEYQRPTFALYDNSILYNDFIVDSLMAIADKIDAAVIYVPDHGQDFFKTRGSALHGSMTDKKSFEAGCQIPFMIYFTRLFREEHPEILERVRAASGKRFNTSFLMNTVMDMAGYDIPGYDVYEKSLFEGKFSSDCPED